MQNRLIWQLAFRYLRGKRSANAVPMLSRISMVAIAVSSCAMIIVFSAFNGLESIIKSNYKAFYPDIKVSVVRGKFFALDTAKLGAISHLHGVRNITTVIEDQVFVNNRDQQRVITLKGIDHTYFRVNDMRDSIIEGDDSVSARYPFTAIVGRQIMADLGVDINAMTYIMLNYPNPSVTNPSADPLSAFQSLKVHPAGVFRIADEFDNKYVLAPLSLVQELFGRPGAYSSVELSVDPNAINDVKAELKQMLGAEYHVESRFEQNKLLFSVMVSERWSIYFILVLVLLIASFNMVGALSMLVLEKQKDIAILKAMGALPSAIRKLFLLEGILWSLIGGLAGILLGILICMAQQNFHFVKLSLVEGGFPIKIDVGDVGLIVVTILTVGVLTSWYPSLRATKAIDPSLKST